eukprot:TRINITY_DN4427_c0_g2_i6.p1 TRINITY_DN4427_c0_g2~~TRINITY_DN4427_c0_g2_i6.p1  ORF type:complete len:124 (+),score=8.64 TRINITY_DN4427_c0_g2_i6:481-852(+)
MVRRSKEEDGVAHDITYKPTSDRTEWVSKNLTRQGKNQKNVHWKVRSPKDIQNVRRLTVTITHTIFRQFGKWCLRRPGLIVFRLQRFGTRNLRLTTRVKCVIETCYSSFDRGVVRVNHVNYVT